MISGARPGFRVLIVQIGGCQKPLVALAIRDRRARAFIHVTASRFIRPGRHADLVLFSRITAYMMPHGMGAVAEIIAGSAASLPHGFSSLKWIASCQL